MVGGLRRIGGGKRGKVDDEVGVGHSSEQIASLVKPNTGVGCIPFCAFWIGQLQGRVYLEGKCKPMLAALYSRKEDSVSSCPFFLLRCGWIRGWVQAILVSPWFGGDANVLPELLDIIIKIREMKGTDFSGYF